MNRAAEASAKKAFQTFAGAILGLDFGNAQCETQPVLCTGIGLLFIILAASMPCECLASSRARAGVIQLDVLIYAQATRGRSRPRTSPTRSRRGGFRRGAASPETPGRLLHARRGDVSTRRLEATCTGDLTEHFKSIVRDKIEAVTFYWKKLKRYCVPRRLPGASSRIRRRQGTRPTR